MDWRSEVRERRFTGADYALLAALAGATVLLLAGLLVAWSGCSASLSGS